MSRHHTLKTWPEFFGAVKSGEKNFEVRRNDRDFQVGDILTLTEYDPITESYTHFDLMRRVIYVLPGGQFGIEEGYCVLGLEKVPVEVSNQPVQLQPAAITGIRICHACIGKPFSECCYPCTSYVCDLWDQEQAGARFISNANAFGAMLPGGRLIDDEAMRLLREYRRGRQAEARAAARDETHDALSAGENSGLLTTRQFGTIGGREDV